MSKRLFTDRPVDLRHIPSPIYLAVEGEQRAAPGGVGATRAAASPTTRASTARRSPTSAT